MDCPVCDVDLVISSREGIEIDHCPTCRGVWLDRGELDKIIERAAPSVVGAGRAAEPPPPPPPAYRDDRRDEPRYDDRDRYASRDRYDERDRYEPRKKKKRGGFLEDLFDFD
jgi:Zn-finger nucleic acid-binding protein